MPFHRPIGSDPSISPAVGTRHPALSRCDAMPLSLRRMQRKLTRGPSQIGRCSTSAISRKRRPARSKTTSAAGERTRNVPVLRRLHASIAECPMEWAWQHPPSVVIDPGEKERSAGNLLNAGRFARGPWLGGVAFALLAAGVISAVAMVQSGRSLPAGEVPPPATLMAAHVPGAHQPGPAEAPVSPGRVASAARSIRLSPRPVRRLPSKLRCLDRFWRAPEKRRRWPPSCRCAAQPCMRPQPRRGPRACCVSRPGRSSNQLSYRRWMPTARARAPDLETVASAEMPVVAPAGAERFGALRAGSATRHTTGWTRAAR